MSNFMPRRQLRCFGLPILAFLSVFVAVLYQRAFGVGVLSDGLGASRNRQAGVP
jgi:hypothetical protein